MQENGSQKLSEQIFFSESPSETAFESFHIMNQFIPHLMKFKIAQISLNKSDFVIDLCHKHYQIFVLLFEGLIFSVKNYNCCITE